MILNQKLVNPDKIIFAHPKKLEEHTKQAAEAKVKKVTFDTVEELEKIKELHPEAEVVLRIKTHDEKSVIQFSKKFGAHEENWETIIKKCKEMNLNFIGVSFHVGTGSYEPNTFIRAIEDASSIFKMATKYGFNLHLLDIGGGFPGFDDTTPSFEEFAEAVNSSIKLYFGEYKNLRVISEPGRFFVEQSQYLITKIVSRNILEENQISEATEILESIKISDDSDNEDNIRGQYRNKYFIKESTSLSFSNALFESCKYFPKLVEDHSNEKTFVSNFYGITDCKNELICLDAKVPILNLNEYVYFPDMGAYTTCIAEGMNINGYTLTNTMIYCWCKDSLFNREENFDEFLFNL